MNSVITPGWATYLRVSDEDKQSPERSFAMQRHSIEQHLLRPSGIALKREYHDKLTGTNPNLADYQLMLKGAEAGEFSHLGLYRADRFGRNAAEGLQAATELIGQGIKIRVANMPSLTPETPDGFFMFLIQMGLAQREVDVLRMRTRDGMEAKARAGGWPYKAPEGYDNKEKLISSGKYERWVEKNPDHWQGIRDAWDLLLTGRFTLEQICEELDRRGHTRSTGRPWVWNNPKNGKRMYAKGRLHEIFHSPFYAGYFVSEKFGIKMGEVKGRWEPTLTREEYEKGLTILHQNAAQKSRTKRHIYLLRNLLWVQVGERCYKMYGSTPSGRTRSYPYYITHARPDGSKQRIRCQIVDDQISGWLAGISLAPDLIPAIRSTYQAQVTGATRAGREAEISGLQRRLTQLRGEEARLGRLFITGKISEGTYDQLREEWQESLRLAEEQLANLKRDESIYLDDLEAAMALMLLLGHIHERLDVKHRTKFLQIVAKRIIVDTSGEIIDHQLHAPFTYLVQLARECETALNQPSGSEQVRLGVLDR